MSGLTNTSTTRGRIVGALCLCLGLYAATSSGADIKPDTASLEAAIAQRLSALEQTTETKADRAWLEDLLGYQEVSRRPHPERAGLSLPRHAIAARARVLLQRWDTENALRQLRAKPGLRHKAATTAVEIRALALWAQQANDAELSAFRASSDPAQWPEELLAAVLRRQPRWDDWLTLATVAQRRDSLELIRDRTPLDDPRYPELLDTLAANPALAGAVPALRARWITGDPLRGAELLAQLHEHHWDTTLIATALYANPPGLTAALVSGLSRPEHAALAAWGLWRLDTAEARQHLADYAVSATAVPHLAEEIHTWLH